MTQSRLSSFYEATLNTAIGFVVSYILALVVYPLYGMRASSATYFSVSLIFTAASLLRGYVIRRWFNRQLHAMAARLAKE